MIGCNQKPVGPGPIIQSGTLFYLYADMAWKGIWLLEACECKIVTEVGKSPKTKLKVPYNVTLLRIWRPLVHKQNDEPGVARMQEIILQRFPSFPCKIIFQLSSLSLSLSLSLYIYIYIYTHGLPISYSLTSTYLSLSFSLFLSLFL